MGKGSNIMHKMSGNYDQGINILKIVIKTSSYENFSNMTHKGHNGTMGINIYGIEFFWCFLFGCFLNDNQLSDAN